MKNYKLFLYSLFSMVLVSSCITVPRIDKKDSRNNQFSQQLQNFMAVKHPQKIDTSFKQIKSDTIWGPLILDTNIAFGNWRFLLNSHGEGFYIKPDLNKIPYPEDSFSYPPGRSDMGLNGGDSLQVITFDTVMFPHIKPPCVPKIYHQYIYIHDTVTNAVINHSEVDALSSYLKVSRDSISMFQLKYSQSKSAGLIKLFIAIGLGLLLIVGIILYIQKK